MLRWSRFITSTESVPGRIRGHRCGQSYGSRSSAGPSGKRLRKDRHSELRDPDSHLARPSYT